MENGRLTKSDYMRLPKERLAELLEERDEQDRIKTIIPYQPALGGQYNPPCYAPDGICTNPYHDCINCPMIFGNGTTITSDGTNLKPIKPMTNEELNKWLEDEIMVYSGCCSSIECVKYDIAKETAIKMAAWKQEQINLLLDAIDYAYLKTDGTYGDLALVVADKVEYLKSLRQSSL